MEDEKTDRELELENQELRRQLYEATETIEAIRTGQIDALVVQGQEGHQLYTLKTADQSYRVLIEKMAESVVTLEEHDTIVYCNSQFAELLQVPLSKIMGLPFAAFVTEADRPQYQLLFEKAWQLDTKGEIILQHNNITVPVQLSFARVDMDDLMSLSVIITDLSGTKKAQLELEQKNQMLFEMNTALEASNHDLQQFASIASHDLQEPLRKIQMFASLLREKEGGGQLNAESQAWLAKITSSAARMKTLIVDVLNYSKLSSKDNAFTKVDLNEILQEMQEDFELLIIERQAVITASGLPVIEANRGQIRQVFQNIISNALKFVKAGIAPQITITGEKVAAKSFNAACDSTGAWCRISIRDNGIGFDKQYGESIFGLFERLHSKDKYEGTGIGLAITKKIVEKHNGIITARSAGNSGAEFIIILPEAQ